MSDYLRRQLPAPMAADPGIVRFLGIFEEIAGPLYVRAGQHHLLIDPATAPPRMIDWLNSIMGLGHQDGLTMERRRQIVRASNEAFDHRGSAAAIKALLEAYTGSAVKVIEPGGVSPETEDLDREEAAKPPLRRPAVDDGIAAMPRIGRRPDNVVTVELASLGALTEERITALVRQLVPAHLVTRIIVAGQPIAGAGDMASATGEEKVS